MRHFGTSPIQVEVKSVGVSVKIKTPPPLPPASIPVTPGFQTIPKTSLDTSSLDGFTSYIDFSEEINEPIEVILLFFYINGMKNLQICLLFSSSIVLKINFHQEKKQNLLKKNLLQKNHKTLVIGMKNIFYMENYPILLRI